MMFPETLTVIRVQYKTAEKIINPWEGAVVYFKSVTSSTMDDARILVDGGAVNGTVVSCGFQKKGRGRFVERVWVSERSKNLCATLILMKEKTTFTGAMVPLLTGLALSLCIENTLGVHTTVKWPNDIMFGRKKIAGVLCESYCRAVLAGFGVNCNQEKFTGSIAAAATSLRIITGRKISVSIFLGDTLRYIKSLLQDSAWLETLNNRLAFQGEKTCITIGHPHTDNHGFVEGIIERIDSNGNLVVIDTNTKETRTIVSGEIGITGS
jgi:BirA family biotin operon repressor/biotin-[acetyl-CoA-carboxylase] ligase